MLSDLNYLYKINPINKKPCRVSSSMLVLPLSSGTQPDEPTSVQCFQK